MQFQTNDWWHFLHSLPWSLLVFMLQKGKVQSDFYTSVVTAALKLWVFFNALKLLSQHLIVQSQQWKHKNRVWNIWKVNNKYTRMTSCCRFGVFIVNFEQISHIVLIFPLLTLNKRMPAWHNANLFKNFITFLGYVKRLLYFFCFRVPWKKLDQLYFVLILCEGLGRNGWRIFVKFCFSY